jgi:hypothetical protein
MSNFLRDLLAFLGYDRLTLDLDEESRGQVVRASVVPLIVVLALAVQLGVEVRYENPLFGFAGEQVPEFWRHAYPVAFTVAQFGPPLAAALLFASGIQPWTRAGGSWMVLLGLLFVILAVGFGVSAATIHAIEDPQQAFTLRSQTWANWAYSFGFLAIGYFFVAYRAGRTPLRWRRPGPPRRARTIGGEY